MIPLSKPRPVAVLMLALAFIVSIVAMFLFHSALTDSDTFWNVGLWWKNFFVNRSPLPGVFATLLAGILFVIGFRQTGLPEADFDPQPQNPPITPPRFGFWLTSLGLSALAAGAITYTAGQPPHGYLALGLWALAVILVLISALMDMRWQPPTLAELRRKIEENRQEILLVGLIVAAALFLRIYNLETYPYSFVNDEGEMAKQGLCILRGACTDFFYMAWAAQPWLAMTPITASIALFGQTAFAARLPAAIFGSLAVLNTYLFAREVLNRRVAWIAAALLAALPVHIHFSRLAVDNFVDSFFSSALLWLLYRGVKRGDRLAYILAGLVGGLTLYTYPGSRLSLALGFGTLVYLAMRVKGYLRNHLNHLIVFAFVLIVTATPMTAYFIQHPEHFGARLRAENIFMNGVLQSDQGIYGVGPVAIVFRQFFRSSLVFFATPAEIGFFDDIHPYIPALAALFFIGGLAFVTTKIGDPRYMTLFAWFWSAILIGSTITSVPPSNERMMNSIPALALITAIGLHKSGEILASLGRLARRAVPFLLILAVMWTSAESIYGYFWEYNTLHRWENTTNELTYESRLQITPLGSQGRFLLIGDPLVFIIFANFDYFAPDVVKSDFNTVTPEELQALPKDKDVLFIAIPYRLADLENIARWIPGGEWRQIQRRNQPTEALYYSYKITKEQLQAFTP